jgi:predicted CoA-binding protein
MKRTVVIGASLNPERISHEAVIKLKRKGHDVFAIGLREGEIEGVKIQKGKPDLKDIDTVTLYLNAKRQEEMNDYILNLHPKRIIFNPGAENPELMKKAANLGIEVEEACTLTLLAIGLF